MVVHEEPFLSNPSPPTDPNSFTQLGDAFQSAMEPVSRHRRGAHYTEEDDILQVVRPTLLLPFQKRLVKSQTEQALNNLLREIRSHRVLDPSCGSGNFLYVAFRVLRQLEDATIKKLMTLGHPSLGQEVGLHQLYGLDLDSNALEVARQVLERALSNYGGTDTAPSLQCGDALQMPWPEVDAIIGNPPFQSKNKRQQVWGAEAVRALQKAFPEVPGRADYCVYFFRRAHDHLKHGQRAGLVGTNTIRENDSRVGGLDHIVANGGTIVDAIASQKWGGDAAVFVSIVNWIKGAETGPFSLRWQEPGGRWNGAKLSRIPSSLSPDTDVTQAQALHINRTPKRVFQGQTHGHSGFLVPKTKGALWLQNAPEWSAVLHPFMNGKDLLKASFDDIPRYVIDFGARSEEEAKAFGPLFTHVKEQVHSTRRHNAAKEQKRNQALLGTKGRLNHHHQNFLKRWWSLSYPRAELVQSISNKNRYIACSRVTRYPIFQLVDAHIRPSDAISIFDFEDAYSFGILQSGFHCDWFAARCSTLGIGLRYTSNTVFDSFPWPQFPSIHSIHDVAQAAARLLTVRESALAGVHTLTELYRAPPPRLTTAQKALDHAVAVAYRFDPCEDRLGALLSLNKACARRETEGGLLTGPGRPAADLEPIGPDALDTSVRPSSSK